MVDTYLGSEVTEDDIGKVYDDCPTLICTYSLLNLESPLYQENQIPDSLKKIPISKPGSRFIK